MRVGRFLAATLAVSLPLEVGLIVVGWKASTPFVFGLVPLLIGAVPALSVMSAAVGAPLGRKVRFNVGLLCFVFGFYLIAFWTGWYRVAMLRAPSELSAPGLLSAVYRLVPIASPITALVLFAGKQPSVFWESRPSVDT